ncbi:MAG: 50S ribosomal protein L6 [Pseudomonadota bacterium]|jgi:large subunit ribosomal protein L6|nr:50S ribosomal protein L6 [Pseudomonadota bacterium]
MSRVANAPVELPSGVEVKMSGQDISVKGGKGELAMVVHNDVEVIQEENLLKVTARNDDKGVDALAGTMRALVANMVVGVTNGFERRLELQGVGYRAQVRGKTINLQVGFSHSIDYALPEGISAETPSQTEIVISGIDKQLVGQVCAEIRAHRPPEPYKGKGVRYQGEYVRRKDAKKK